MDIIAQSGTVTGRKIEDNRDKDRPTRMLQLEVTAPQDVQTVEHLTQCGEDTGPTDGAQAVIIGVGQAWKVAIVTDDKVEPSAAPGEKRLYSTNAAGDTVKASIWLRDDGRVHVNNDAARATLEPTGEILISNSGASVTISPAGVVTILAAADITLQSSTAVKIVAPAMTHNGTNIGATHVHSGVDTGPSNTGGPQ